MRFASLGSGSAGNALVVEEGTTRLLLDCGFGLRESVMRLARLGLAPEQLSGILVTHEHEDHIGGVFRLAGKYRIPIWLTHGTFTMAKRYLSKPAVLDLRIMDSHASFAIGDLQVQPYPVPHDAREPVQFVFAKCSIHRQLWNRGVQPDISSQLP